MHSSLTLGIDIGTGSVKVTLLEPTTGWRAEASAPHPVHQERAGWAEQDPEDWWNGVRSAVRQVCQADRKTGRAVSAIAVSGQGAGLVLLDARGNAVRPALIHLDQRAEQQADRLSRSPVGSAVEQASGNVIGAWNTAAKLTWVREKEPDAYAGTQLVTSAAGFVLHRLVGQTVQSSSDAGISDLFDLSDRTWSRSVLDALDVPISSLPELAEATDEVGLLRSSAADELGLSPYVRVIAGGEDTSSAALAAGAVNAADAYLSLGTAGVVGVVVRRGQARESSLLAFPHVLRHRDLLSGSMSSAGAAVSWCASITGTDSSTLLDEVEHVSAGAGGVTFLPYLAGEIHPINDPAARGVFAGLSLSTTRAELGRAVIEGSANAVAHNLAVAYAAGVNPSRLVATGRPTRSRAWMQAVSDATGLPVECVLEAGASMGDAILAASSDDSEAVESAIALRQVHACYEPRSSQSRDARERRALADRLYQATRANR